MNKYKGTKTEQNLRDAFSAESEARNKYYFFSAAAKKDGYEQIAEIFRITAENEKEHAEIWFKELGGMGSNTEKNLESAAKGEHFEWSDMYESYAADAEEEGFTALAEKFRMIGAIEKEHEQRYRKLIKNMKNGEVFERGSIKIWECRNCGHITVATSAPKVCPVCGKKQAYFEIKAKNY